MQKYDIHVCVISDQAAANLLPILDNKFAPQKAVFLVSQEMKEAANYLEKVFNTKGIEVIQKTLYNVWDFEQCEIELSYIAEEYKDTNIALNITGGNKLLSIAAYQAFERHKKEIFYVDTKNKRITFLTKNSSSNFIQNIELDSKGEIDSYLSAYGIKSIQDNHEIDNKSLNEMVDCFITNFEQYYDLLPKINTYASQLKDFKSAIVQDDLENEDFLFLLLRLKNANKGKGIIKYNDGVIDFKDPKTRFFMNGGWLEDFIYRKLQEIKSVSDVRCGLKVDNDLGNTNDEDFDNELDVAFMANNKLHIIECKSGKMTVEIGNKAIDKLNNLKRYGGSMTKACFISYSYVPLKVRKKAESMNIEIISDRDLQQVTEALEAWIIKRD